MHGQIQGHFKTLELCTSTWYLLVPKKFTGSYVSWRDVWWCDMFALEGSPQPTHRDHSSLC